MPGSSFTAIIACAHDADSLKSTLSALRHLEYPELSEVIIMDDGTHPRRDEAASSPTFRGLGIRYFNLPEIGKASAWNLGVRESGSEFLVFLDDDCIPPPGWLKAFQDTFSQEWTAGVVGGPDKVPPKASLFERCLDYVLRSFIGSLGIRNGSSRFSRYYPRPWNMAARTEAVRYAGGFDESIRESPEVMMIRRLEKIGYKSVYQPKALVHHRRETNLIKFLRKGFRLGMDRGSGSAQPGIGRVYGGVLGLLAVLGVLTFFFGTQSAAFTAAKLLLGAYAAALILAGLHSIIPTRNPLAVILVPVMLALHHAAHIGGFAIGRLSNAGRRRI